MTNSAFFRVGIVGAGHIAEKAARTLLQMEDATCLAIASRSLEKAREFGRKWDIPRAYGSYDELLSDPEVDLIYVALPHSHHYEVTRRALLQGKPCLVEKSFMANAAEAEEILRLSRERHVLVAEAIWTRYQPWCTWVRDRLEEGVTGRPRLLTATLAYDVSRKERILRPELCGGALLDLGVYAIHFMRAVCDSPVVRMQSQCVKFDTGVDMTESISYVLENAMLASLHSCACCQGDNIGVIAGEKANIVVDNLTNPHVVRVFARDHALLQEWEVPAQITGFEYEFRSCRDAIARGEIEVPEVPHREILYVMNLMDDLRREWKIRFPMDGGAV